MIGIIDYGRGNIGSIINALDNFKIPFILSDNVCELEKCQRYILPGVGSFKDAMTALEASGLIPFIKKIAKDGKPLLGICLGMQILLDIGYEDGKTNGLGLISGEVKYLDRKDLKVPHMGWNTLNIKYEDDLLENIEEGESFYFVHSYECVLNNHDNILATTDYEGEIVAIIKQDNIYGIQFHPEKSSKKGLEIIENFWRSNKKC